MLEALLLLIVGCGQEATPTADLATPPPTPTVSQGLIAPTVGVTPASTFVPSATPTIMPTVPARVAPTETPWPTIVPTNTPTVAPAPLMLNILSPRDGATVEIGAVRVLAQSQSDAVVAINGVTADVPVDGGVQRDVVLVEGTNIIEVLASDLSGQTVFQSRVVFFTPPGAGLPFSILYPFDGIEVTNSAIPLIGATSPDSVLAVNGDLVDVNLLGIFSRTAPLNPGANVIEVVAADIEGNQRPQTLVVFYVP